MSRPARLHDDSARRLAGRGRVMGGLPAWGRMLRAQVQGLMRRLRLKTHAPTAVLLAWALAAFGWAPVAHAGHALRVATAFEVCGSFGHRKVDADGQPVDTQARHDDACCLMPPLAPPPAVPGWAAMPLQPDGAATPLSQPRLAAEWLGALSRGPPVRA